MVLGHEVLHMLREVWNLDILVLPSLMQSISERCARVEIFTELNPEVVV
jgi:hypothetical protein